MRPSMPNLLCRALRFELSRAITKSLEKNSSSVILCALWDVNGMPWARSVRFAGGYISFPVSSLLTPAEEISKEEESPRSSARLRNMNSAIGERHILPWHTNMILMKENLSDYEGRKKLPGGSLDIYGPAGMQDERA